MPAFESILDFALTPYRYYPTGETLKGCPRKNAILAGQGIDHRLPDCYGRFATEGFRDPLGEFYMMHISHGHLGQYFTPEPITDFMAMAAIVTTPSQGRPY